MGSDSQTRKQRKRDERAARRDNKPAFGAEGLTRKQLMDAEDELDSLTTQHTSSHGVVWTTFVEQWQAVEYQRESAKTAYSRVIELKKLGRTVDTPTFVKVYAESKMELQLLEDQMVAFLGDEEFGDEEIRSFLYDQRAVPGKGMAIRLPEALIEILLSRIKAAPDDQNDSHDAVAVID